MSARTKYVTTVRRDMGRARRRNRLAGIHWADALYRVYVLGIGLGGLVWGLASMLGHRRIAANSYPSFAGHASGVVGLIIAVVVLGAIRSGLRGGPLAIDAAEVAHVLQAPIDRGTALRHTVVQQYRRGAYLGVIAGGVAGRLLVPFVVGNRVGWTLWGALLGMFLGLAWMGCAAIVSGRRLRKPFQLPAWGLLAWSVFDVWQGRSSSPLTRIGRSVMVPLRWSPRTVSWEGLPSAETATAMLCALTIALCALGFAGIGGLRIEQAERRAQLVDQLRFAVTTQDLRSTLLLRRQLTAEQLRAKPWFTVRSGRGGNERAVVVRSLRSVSRWPVVRILRVVGTAVVAGVCARLAIGGTLPLLILPGMLAFLAGLDAVEPLSQDADHPGLLAGLPRHRGRLANRQLIVPGGVLAVAGQFGAVAAWITGVLLGKGIHAFDIFAGVVIAVLWGAVGAVLAGLSVALGPPPMRTLLQNPEIGSIQSIAPVAVSSLATGVVLFLLHNAGGPKRPAGPALVNGVLFGLVIVYFALQVVSSGGIRDRNAT